MKTNDIYKIYPTLSSKFYVFIRSRILHFKDIKKELPEYGKIYDIGCGYGILSHFIASISENLKVIGIDLDKKRIDTCSEIFRDIKNLKFLRKDLREDNKISPADIIITYDLLHHIPFESQIELIENCIDNLKPSGKLLIKEIDNSKKFGTFFTWILDMIMTKGEKVYYRDLREWVEVLEKKGLNITLKEIKSFLPFPHFLLIATKNVTQNTP